MMSGDEFYDDETTSGLGSEREMHMDVLAAADYKRDRLEDSFACRVCGSPDPAVIKRGIGCSDCHCWLVAHIPDCPGAPNSREGHVLREGWIAYEDKYGVAEVEVR